MVLEISQETFDEAVKENIEILGLTEDEAVEEATKQYESQGVDLSKIIKRSMSKQEIDALHENIKKLEQLQKTKGSQEPLNRALELIRLDCEKGIQHKVEAAKVDAYPILLNTYDTFKDKVVRTNTIKTLIALMTKQPDILDDRGIETIINNLKDANQDPELQTLFLKWTKECCVMHEKNRQKIFDAHIVDVIKVLFKETTPIEVIRESMSVCRALVLDDDIRVQFGKSHEHARVIAGETLCPILTLLSKFRGEEQVNFDIILTLAALMVRNEFCKKVQEAGGLDLIKMVMETFCKNEKIIKQCFNLLKALAGNDEVKDSLIRKGYASTIQENIICSLNNAPTVTAGLAAAAAICLRSPENSKVFFEGGFPEVIVKAMQTHEDQKSVQKTGSWAIRNMVSRSKHQGPKFIDLGVEQILRKDLKNFKEIEYDIKAALRDLDCKVNLKEEWTGRGGAITTGLFRE